MKLQLLFLLVCANVCGQLTADIASFEHHFIYTDNDTINYHVHTRPKTTKTTHLLVYVQGSSAKPLYQMIEKDGQIRAGTTLPFYFDQIPNDYLFVVISKKGFPFVAKTPEELEVPQSYYENQTLDYRVFQVHEVLKKLTKTYQNTLGNIVVLGHSEGSDVIAKLGTINTDITHFGFWSGGGNTQFIDFITFIRKEVDKGKMTEAEAEGEIASVFKKLREIMANPDATDKFWSGKANSYKRWSHFSEPPVENLLQIKKPIFAAIGTQDQSVALESAYLIPVEFIRHGKDNLTFKTYPGLDHGFGKVLENGQYEDHWPKVFNDFLAWIAKN